MNSLIVITSSFFFEQEIFLVRVLFEQGLERLHLRKPHASALEIEKFVLQIPVKFRSKVIIHHQWRFNFVEQCGGLHGSLKNHEKRDFKGLRSVPCHSLEECFKLPDFISYCFLSPIFDSISKINVVSSFDVKVLKKALEQGHKTPIFALGGVNKDNIEICYQIGFQGVSVLGAIWNQPNPLESFLIIQQKVREIYGR